MWGLLQSYELYCKSYNRKAFDKKKFAYDIINGHAYFMMKKKL